MARCVFRETPPPLIPARLVEPSALANAIRESFYGGDDVELALYPSLEDVFAVLSERLGGLRPATPLPVRVARLVGEGRVLVYANPTPLGETLTCDDVCGDEPVVVYEGGRVAMPAGSLASCPCLVYTVASLEDYGVESSVAWVTGLEGGVRSGRLPGLDDLSGIAGLVRRLRARSLAALMRVARVERAGPFAAFTAEPPAIPGEVVGGERYGARGLLAVSLFMERGCYTPL